MNSDQLRARRVRRLTWIVRSGVTMAAVGALSVVWPQQHTADAFRPRVLEPAFTSPRPRALIDEGHFNLYAGADQYQPLARLLRQDGFRVSAGQGAITPVLLRGVDVYITANSLGYLGMAQQLADRVGLEGLVRLDVRPFTDSEIATLAAWVRAGGRALIVADHAPAARGAERLAYAFGVEMIAGWLEEATQASPEGRPSGTLVFSREASLLGAHPILEGRDERERIKRVMTFGGQALRPGPHGVGLLLKPSTTREFPSREAPDARQRSAAGLAQAVAVTFGAGRVVVMAEGGTPGAQLVDVRGVEPLMMGVNRVGVDNQQFALNVIRWLMGVLP